MSYLDQKYFPTVEPLNNRYPCVFIPGIFSYKVFDYYSNPSYWGLSPDVQSIENNNNYYFTNIGFFMSAHDAACHVFAQLYGGYADYGEEHAKQHKHPRYGTHFYPSALIDWTSDRPIIVVSHSHGAMVAQKFQQLLAEDFWQKGTNSGWIRQIITVNGAMNGSPLIRALGIKIENKQVIYPLWLKFLILILNLLLWFLNKIGLDEFIVNIIDPFTITSLKSAITNKTSILNGMDNIVYELSYEGAQEFQKSVKPYDTTVYLNFTTRMNWTRYIPYPTLFAFFIFTNIYMNIFGTPKKYSNKKVINDYNFMNDGAVTVASQMYPYLNKNNFPSQEITLIDLHNQYANLKFKKAALDDSSLVKEGVYYYINLDPKINNHLRFTLDSLFLPYNDLFYRSVCDFVRQYNRHFELKALQVLDDESTQLLAQQTQITEAIQQDIDTKVTLISQFLQAQSVQTSGIQQDIDTKVTQISQFLQAQVAQSAIIQHFSTILQSMYSTLLSDPRLSTAETIVSGQITYDQDTIATLNTIIGNSNLLTGLVNYIQQNQIVPTQTNLNINTGTYQDLTNPVALQTSLDTADDFAQLAAISARILAVQKALNGTYTQPDTVAPGSVSTDTRTFIDKFVRLVYMKRVGIDISKLTGTTNLSQYPTLTQTVVPSPSYQPPTPIVPITEIADQYIENVMNTIAPNGQPSYPFSYINSGKIDLIYDKYLLLEDAINYPTLGSFNFKTYILSVAQSVALSQPLLPDPNESTYIASLIAN